MAPGQRLAEQGGRPSRPRWAIPFIAGLAVLFLVAAGATWALTRAVPAAPTPTQSATGAATTIINGDLTLTSARGVRNTVGSICTGTGGYDDIQAGASVTVTDANGTTIALGSLLLGETSELIFRCVFPIRVLDVPMGKGFYGIEVAHRGKVQIAEADLAAGVHLTLG